MKKLLIIIIAAISFVACKAQDYDALKQQLNEKLDSLNLVKNENILLKDSVRFLKLNYFNPFDSENYDAELDYSDSTRNYTYNQKGDTARLYIRKPQGGVYLFVFGTKIKMYVSPPTDSTSRTYLIEDSDIKWYK